MSGNRCSQLWNNVKNYKPAFAIKACVPEFSEVNPFEFAVGDGFDVKVGFIIFIAIYYKPMPVVVLVLFVLVVKHKHGDGEAFIYLRLNDFSCGVKGFRASKFAHHDSAFPAIT